MAISPASPEAEGSPGRDRAGYARPRRRISRWVIRVLLLAVVLLAFSTPALAATHAVHAPHATRATAVQASPAVGLTPAVPRQPGGVCQVPGIGDIGGLVGLCNQGSSGIVGDLNNICQPSLPQPEQATGGIDAMVQPPGAVAAAGGQTLYDNYGVAGQFWAAHGLQCSDMTSLIGNNVAGMVFDAAKSVDRVTITVYQSAAGNNILTWLQDAVDRLISALGNAIYFPYLAPVVILGAIWLAWQGLVRKRATRTIEGTLWMVVACVAAIALIGRPAAFTGVGTTVSNGVTQVLNTAFSKLPVPASSNCLPVQQGDPQAVTGNFAYTSGSALVDENANELWSVLVCKPWLYGELGSTAYATSPNGQQTVVNKYGRQLLWAQAIAANETPSTTLVQAKQSTYSGIASSMQQQDPAVYPLFQGNQWTTRMEISFAAMFAALVAGLLILLIALTLIVLKLGFLLLLVAGPFFLIIGTHPGFGRVIAIRWFEMLVGVLMKQAAIAIVLSVLLYCYSLIMGTADNVLPWALKILMIALVTVAVFIYRKPFSHLFSAVGYGTIGSTERAEYSLREASHTFRRSTLDAATVAVPGVAGRAARWARRNPGQAAAVAAGAAAGVAAGTATGAAAATEAAGATGAEAGPAMPTRRGCGQTRRPRPTGTARRAAAPAGSSAGSAAKPARPGPRTWRRRTVPAGGSPRRSTCRPGPAPAGPAGRTGRRVRPDPRPRRLPAGPVAPGARRVPGRGRRRPPRRQRPPRRPVHRQGPRRSGARVAQADPRRRSAAPHPARPTGPVGPTGPAGPAGPTGPAGPVAAVRPGRPADGRLRGPVSDQAAGPGRTRLRSRPRTRAAASGPTARTNRRPCRSGCARSAGTSSGRPPWISVPASKRLCSLWSSWSWPRSATGSWCRR